MLEVSPGESGNPYQPPLATIHPEILRRAAVHYSATQSGHADQATAYLDAQFQLLAKLIDTGSRRRVGVIGCGPEATAVRHLASRGFKVRAIDPEQQSVDIAQQRAGAAARIETGTAESLPWQSNSVDIIVCESVLEHVDSPRLALSEMHRCLDTGGVAYIVTTARWQFNARGYNGEFNIPFYNWFPKLVKESYVNVHLHSRPDLANFTPRPAVHWFTFAQLCERGRDAGFARFYSTWDLREADDAADRKPWDKAPLLRWYKKSPWFRALVLTQASVVFMVRR